MCYERRGLAPMVVNDLDIVRIALPERKANAPAGVHGHRPLAGSVPFEFMQPNAFEWAQILQPRGNVQGRQQVRRRGEVCAFLGSSLSASLKSAIARS